MRFKDLPVDQTFVFSSERTYPLSGMATGPWRKLSERTYQHAYTPERYGQVRVGSVNVEVELVGLVSPDVED